jgi:type I restriction enzyme R subunit
MTITAIKHITVQTFDAKGGRGKMWQLFGDEMETIINELNEVLAA